MAKTSTYRGLLSPAMLGMYALLVLLVVLHFPSLKTMWFVWGDSNTYTHGYLVFPMVVYLIATRWGAFTHAEHSPKLIGALALLACGLVWVVSQLLNVHVVGQLMFVSMIALLCFSYFGAQKSRVILFPLAYMFFAVPMGEALVPKLMSFTADFTVWALKVTGLPVYRDGMFFSIPAGDFEVAKACSGIRYLMASFALGTLYAFLSFRSLKKQILFGVLSLVVPIVANGIRAYGIVMIAHFSDMKYAVGVDHLVYGWLFFGVVMFFLFYVGGKFRSDEDKIELAETLPPAGQIPVKTLLVTTVVLAVALLLPHALNSYVKQIESAGDQQTALPSAVLGWTGPDAKTTSFEPYFTGAVATTQGHYSRNGKDIFIWIYLYPAFNPEHEMITATNTIADLDKWAVYEQLPKSESYTGTLPVVETRLGNRRDEYTIWHWYQVNDSVANGLIKAKLAEARAVFSGSLPINEALVVIATPERGDEGVETLSDFVEQHRDTLVGCAVHSSTQCIKSVL